MHAGRVGVEFRVVFGNCLNRSCAALRWQADAHSRAHECCAKCHRLVRLVAAPDVDRGHLHLEHMVP